MQKARARKKNFLAVAAILCILLPLFIGCQGPLGGSGEGEEIDESSHEKSDEPSQINPFIGVWKETDTKFWQFKTNGTGGTAATAEGPFRDDFSFLVHIKQPADETGYTSLVLLEDSLPVAPDTSLVSVTRYTFTITGNQATLSPVPSPATDITLTRVSGSPQALSLENQLIGEWDTKWSLNGTTWMAGTNKWSLKYREDGTVRTYHLSAGHQFENAYALRGNTLVIYGQRRFTGQAGTSLPNPSFIAIKTEISYLGNDTWRVEELESYAPAQNSALVSWIYTKVDAATWK